MLLFFATSAVLCKFRHSINGVMKKAHLVFFAFFATIILSNAQSAGPFTPSAYSTSGTGAGWANLSGVHALDNNPAYVDLAQYPTCNSFICYYSDIAHFTGFGFSIPINSVITGIQVSAMQRVSSPGGGIRDSMLFLSLNGTTMGSDYADPSYWLDTPTLNTYGNSADMWGYSWTPAEVNDPTFGLQYRLTNDSYDQPASLDFLTMTIYYQAGTGISSQTSSPWVIGFKDESLHITAEASILSKGVRIEVRNLDGKLQYSNEIDQGLRKLNLNIDAGSWSPGLYLINISSADGATFQHKAILMK